MISSKELFLKLLNRERTDRIPCALHWWGIYKYHALGLDFKKDAWQDGAHLVKVYSDFYEKIKPDWFHLHIGTPRYFENSEIVEKDGKSFLIIDPKHRALKKEDKYFSVNSPDDEEIVDFPDYLLGSRSFKPKVDLGSKWKIDDYIKRYIHMTAQEIKDMGYTDHIPPLVEKYGDSVFINVHIPSAVCEIFDPTTGYTGFEEGLIAFYEYPKGMFYLLERCYEEQLEWAKAYADAGAHAYTISETYISPDIVNPNIYRTNLKSIHRDCFSEIKNMGIIPICNFWGDVNPILEDLTEINCVGLMFEESKKTFTLDIVTIKERIGDRICVFGNLDTITLLTNGTPEEITEEVYRQAGMKKDNFIMANGSPVTMGTPEINVITLIEATHSISV